MRQMLIPPKQQKTHKYLSRGAHRGSKYKDVINTVVFLYLFVNATPPEVLCYFYILLHYTITSHVNHRRGCRRRRQEQSSPSLSDIIEAVVIAEITRFFTGKNSARQMISLRVQGNKIGLQTTKDHLKVFNKEHCQLRQNMMENRASESRTTPVPLHCATQLQKVGQQLIKTKSSSWNSDNL